eukprot:13066948-Heterocapsa_arctica.AAC.1
MKAGDKISKICEFFDIFDIFDDESEDYKKELEEKTPKYDGLLKKDGNMVTDSSQRNEAGD